MGSPHHPSQPQAPQTAEEEEAPLSCTTTQQNNDSFSSFFELWIAEQNQYLQEMIRASENPTTRDNDNDNDNNDQSLRTLIERVILHYEKYYRAKSQSAEGDVLAMLTPPWRSSLEDAFLWIGGWRPSMAFHLLYSKSGLNFEEMLSKELLLLEQQSQRQSQEEEEGSRSNNNNNNTININCGLSPIQISQIDHLQQKTIKYEKDITEAMAAHQETIADSSMVQLSHAVTELLTRGQGDLVSRDQQEVDALVGSTLNPKKDGFKHILHRADELRITTLKEIVTRILNPIQALHFLIAAAELHLRIHEWGLKRDQDHHHHPPSTAPQSTD